MRPSRQQETLRLSEPPIMAGDGDELPGLCQSCPVHTPSAIGAVSSPMPVSGPMCDWIESQANVLGLWLDRLIAEGDPGDLVSLVHRQHAWLELLRTRLGRG